MNIFGGMKILWIFFWVITKLDHIEGSFLVQTYFIAKFYTAMGLGRKFSQPSMQGSFLKIKVQNGGYFLGLVIF